MDSIINKEIKRRPMYTTGIVANYIGVKTKTLINFENAGLTKVKKSITNRRLYSQMDVLKLILILKLLKEKGMNYKGCKIVLDIVWDNGPQMELLKRIFSNKEIENMVKMAIDI